MKLMIDQALRQGVAAHTDGKLQDAEPSYRAVLQAQPNQPDANHNLCAMLKELGRLDGSETSLRQAVALKPNYAEARSDLGVTLKELGKL